jgi:hypothetical protein
MCQLREELVQLLLPLIEFTAARVVDTKESHDTVDDEQPILIADKELGDFVEKFHLMLRVHCASIGYIVLGCRLSVKILAGL